MLCKSWQDLWVYSTFSCSDRHQGWVCFSKTRLCKSGGNVFKEWDENMFQEAWCMGVSCFSSREWALCGPGSAVDASLKSPDPLPVGGPADAAADKDGGVEIMTSSERASCLIISSLVTDSAVRPVRVQWDACSGREDPRWRDRWSQKKTRFLSSDRETLCVCRRKLLPADSLLRTRLPTPSLSGPPSLVVEKKCHFWSPEVTSHESDINQRLWIYFFHRAKLI